MEKKLLSSPHKYQELQFYNPNVNHLRGIICNQLFFSLLQKKTIK